MDVERKPFKFTSQAQYDWMKQYKPELFQKIQAENPADRSALPERLGPKEDVIYIPGRNGKVYKWRMS